jgi:hypothetical protein
MPYIQLSFKPKQVVKRLLASLPKRAKEILESRYGLGRDAERQTLEAIGHRYGITRERVRQIEEYGLQTIRKSDAFAEAQTELSELEESISSMGAIVSEDELLERFGKDIGTKNSVHLLLVLGETFFKCKEDDHFCHRWHIDKSLADQIHDSLRKLYDSLDNDALLSEADLIGRFLDYLKNVNEKYKNDEVLKRWLSLSKRIGRNPLGEWGKSSSANVSVKGIRDYAYLIIRRHGSPIHFREVAAAITKTFGKRAHVATTHNELIKDPRFVLVGRGLYALTEWGYSAGVVKDVVKRILSKSGPLTKEEIVDRVLKERYVKTNTILVNLQDTRTFNRLDDGRYELTSKK